MGRGFRALARAGVNALAEHASKAAEPPRVSDETKKADIVRITRRVWSVICAQTGAQDPLFYIEEASDGSGLATQIWESEDALLQTAKLALAVSADGAAPPGRAGLKESIERGVEASWKEFAEVKCTIGSAGPEARLSKMTLRFRTSRELLDSMYASCQRQEAQEARNGVGGQGNISAGDAARQIQEIEARTQQTNAYVLQMQQMSGIAPVEYRDGVPVYRGSVANAFNFNP